MTVAVHAIGSTPTAVMGALEPLTAVVIGVTIFGELFTARLAAGIGLILLAVTLIVAGKSLHPGRLAAIIGHRGFYATAGRLRCGIILHFVDSRHRIGLVCCRRIILCMIRLSG
ncbi:hypothetical protein [Alistipes putredinis]|uniref:hypothetical protein n=1 Tax=Alistipes putredinis TaxID=28117 RepID=UPI003AB86CF7